MSMKNRVRGIWDKHLRPLFPQSNLDEHTPKNSTKNVVHETETGQHFLRLQLGKDAKFAFRLQRVQKFTTEEVEIARNFASRVPKILNASQGEYDDILSQRALDLVVAQSSCSFSSHQAAIIIETLTTWSGETYEGQRIACGFGICNDTEGRGLSLADYLQLPAAKVISNGHASLVAVDANGSIKGHEVIGPPQNAMDIYSPLSFTPLSHWTCIPDRTAITLNRNGEILVFSNDELKFARRRGQWMYFPHEESVAQIGNKVPALNNRKDLRRAVYLTALDISFSRSGGAIGLVAPDSKIIGKKNPITPDNDLYDTANQSQQCKALSSLIGNRKFQQLSRLSRQEFGAVDGAIVLDYSGKILATGAILKLEATNQGGRTSAAITLGGYGLGIKISADGQIKAFQGGKVEPLFTVG